MVDNKNKYPILLLKKGVGVSKLYLHILILLSFLIFCVSAAVNAQVYIPHESGLQIAYDTTYGYFEFGFTDGRKLTNGYIPPSLPWVPGPSETHFVLRIDEFYFTYNPYYLDHYPGTFNINSYITSHSISYDPPEITTTWELSTPPIFDLTLTQRLIPTYLDSAGQVRIEYEVSNTGGIVCDCALKLFIDMKTNGCDDPLIHTGSSVLNTGSVWYYPDIPIYYRGYETTPPESSSVVVEGHLRHAYCTAPDAFAIGQTPGLSHCWWDFDSACSEDAGFGEPYTNVGIMARWDRSLLLPGREKSYVTYYGLGETPIYEPGLLLTIPEIIDIEMTGTDHPGCFEISGVATNNDYLTRNYNGVYVCLQFGDTANYYLYPELPYFPNRCMYTVPSVLPYSESGAMTWLVCLTDTLYNPVSDTIFWKAYTTTPLDVDTAFDTTIITGPEVADPCSLCGTVSGTLYSDISPYFVTCEVHVPTDSALIIEPGSSIIFLGHYKFCVDSNALLKAIGTESDSIVFTAADTHLTETSGGHHGIRFLYAGDGCSLKYCIIEYGNTFEYTVESGGGIYCYHSNITISNNRISNNKSDGDGGGIYCGFSTVNIINNLISGNSAHVDIGIGGGICCESSNVRIIGNNINNNFGPNGGGLSCTDSEGQVFGNTISMNLANWGGGIDLSRSDLEIFNNIVINNETNFSGGGIRCGFSSILLINNTFAENSSFRSRGGGLYSYCSSPVLFNNIFYSDTAPMGKEIYLSVYDSRTCTLFSAYSNLDPAECYTEPGSDIIWGPGNINLDPYFADTTFRLSERSPCIDAGGVWVAVPVRGDTIWAPLDDIEGNPRPFDATSSGGWDMGAYEFSSSIETTYVCGGVFGTWNSDESPYYVVCEVHIPPDSTLIIEPGCSIIFTSNYKFCIDSNATLKALGTESEPIIFTAIDSFPTDSSWGHHGIRFYHAAEGCSLAYCKIFYGSSAGAMDEGYNACGGGLFCYYSSPVIHDCVISKNEADKGGGIYLDHSNPELMNNVISLNSAGQWGAGIYCLHSHPGIESNRITQNTASRGGGLYFDSSDPVVCNNTICENNAILDGGGVACWHSNPILVNNTIYLNFGGGIWVIYHSNPCIFNSILWDNTAGREYEVMIDFSIDTLDYDPCAVFLAHTDIDSAFCEMVGDTLGSFIWGSGNINGDPLFSDTYHHLSLSSPCIDRGGEWVISPWGDTIWAPLDDFEGTPRPVGEAWDIGADESDSVFYPDTIHTLEITVFDAVTFETLPGIGVIIYNFYEGGVVNSGFTNSSGIVWLDVLEGIYAAAANDTSFSYYAEFYDGTHHPAMCTPLDIDATSPDTITDVYFYLDSVRAFFKLSGRILNEELDPVDKAFAIVVSSEEDDDWTKSAISDTSGEYTIFLPVGDYYLLGYTYGYVPVLYDNEIIWGRATSISIDTSDIDSIDFTLIKNPFYIIPDTSLTAIDGHVYMEEEGLVTDYDFVPAPAARVYLKDTLSGDICFTGVFTELEGAFNLAGIPEGTYQIIADKLFFDYYLQDIEITGDDVEGIEIYLTHTGIYNEPHNLPGDFALYQNFPNPFNASTAIVYTLPTDSKVKFEVYNILGNLVETLVNTKQAKGSYLIKWQPDDLGSGLYFGKLKTEKEQRSIRIMYLK
ncbi:right-handed parallel beta-helix repeat-containing protein [bacterium]|nr:right-handed parallel beta-helix repeat-containing protein [bacterium]